MGVSGSCFDWNGSERARVASKGRYSAKDEVKMFVLFPSRLREVEHMVPLVRLRTVLPDRPIVSRCYGSTRINLKIANK